VRIAVECEHAPGFERTRREDVIDVLSMPVPVEFDRDAPVGRLLEHAIPVRRDARTAVEHASARVAEDRHAGSLHRVEHARGLIVLPAQLRVW